jgi:hypothetical protein
MWWGEPGDAGYLDPDAYFWAFEIQEKVFLPKEFDNYPERDPRKLSK